jgi:hypothetical protein
MAYIILIENARRFVNVKFETKIQKYITLCKKKKCASNSTKDEIFCVKNTKVSFSLSY